MSVGPGHPGAVPDGKCLAVTAILKCRAVIAILNCRAVIAILKSCLVLSLMLNGYPVIP